MNFFPIIQLQLGKVISKIISGIYACVHPDNQVVFINCRTGVLQNQWCLCFHKLPTSRVNCKDNREGIIRLACSIRIDDHTYYLFILLVWLFLRVSREFLISLFV